MPDVLYGRNNSYDDEKFSDLHRALNEHVGQEIEFQWKSLMRVYRAFHRNSVDILTTIMLPAADHESAMKIMSIEKGEQGVLPKELYFDDLYRTLLNFTGVISTLVDHSRNMMKQYQGTELHSRYLKNVEGIKRDPVTSFVQDLRNYMVHRAVPKLVIRMGAASFEDTGFSIILRSDELLLWPKWKSQSKRFIRQYPEGLVLRDAAQEYVENIEKFYAKLHRDFLAFHARELEELESLRTDLRSMFEIPDDH